MPKDFILFAAIGLLCAIVAGGLGGLFYYMAVVNFVWYLTAIYAGVFFLTAVFAFIAYAMFRASILGETNVIADEQRSF